MTIYESLDLFINEYDAQMITLNSYRMWLVQFFKFVIKKYSIDKIENIEIQHIKDFKNYLIQKNNKGNTINAYLYAIKIFYRFLQLKGIHYDITTTIKLLKNIKQDFRKVLSKEDVEKLLNSFDLTKFLDLRDYIAIGLMLNHGLRNHEVIEIKVNDIDFKKQSIFVKTKSQFNKDVIYISNNTKKIISTYLKKYNFNKNDSLFKNKHGKPLSLRQLNRVIVERMQKVGIEGCTPYSLRHTAAAFFYQERKDIFLTQKFLRHRSTNTTQRYLNSISQSLSFKKDLHLEIFCLR